MECFNGFWSRRVEEERIPACDHPHPCPPLPLAPPEGCRSKTYRWYMQYIVRKHSSDTETEPFDLEVCESVSDSNTMEDFEAVKQAIKHKAIKHSEFYKNLLNDKELHHSESERNTSSTSHRQVSKPDELHSHVLEPREVLQPPGEPSRSRTRRTGVVQMHQEADGSNKFPSVEKFIIQYTDLIQQQMDKFGDQKRSKQTLQPPASGYCSSSNNSDDESRNYDVKRCCSSDSALGDEETLQTLDNDDNNIEVCEDPDLIQELSDEVPPYYPTSKRGSIDHCNIPSKTLIEAHYVPFPLDRKLSDCDSVDESEGKFGSRRQSCFTDDGEEQPRYRYWRTPSVVVSDYSDDVIGGFLSFEELEYFRNHRKDLSSPDSSLNSSCSNLNYCGSSVSVLDNDYTLRTPSRKASDCSSCSTVSGDEENVDNHLQPLTATVYGIKVSLFLF